MIDVLSRFTDVRRSGNGWTAKCPAHDDTHSSLSIAHGETHPWLLKCHKGCSTEAILAAAGLEPADILAARQTGARGPRPRVIAEYDYTDEHGARLFQVQRLEPKGFRQRRPDSRGDWSYTLGNVRRVLYGLPALQGQPVVYIVEGEKDVETLRAFGLTATCNAGGAGKWRDDYTAQLRAAGVASVVILPDNDDVGLSHADQVARACAAARICVQVLRLPNLPAKGDVSDWRAAGHTRDELDALVTAAPQRHAPTHEHDAEANYPRPVLVRLADVAPETITWLWPGRLGVGKLALVVGDPGLGKSWLTLDVAARVSAGRAWPDGAAAHPPADVLLLSAEDGLADTVRPRLDALGADVARVTHLPALRARGQERAITLADVGVIERAITETHARLVIIDPVTAYLGGTDSHRDADVRGLLAPIAQLADRYGVAILGVMHLSKGMQRPAIYRTGGSIAFNAAARVVLAVAADPNRDDRRIVASIKTNLSTAPTALAFTLNDGRLNWDADPVTDVDVNALLAGPTTDGEERREADDWLKDMLAHGPVQTRELQDAARGSGIAWRTVERAKPRLGVDVERVGFPTPRPRCCPAIREVRRRSQDKPLRSRRSRATAIAIGTGVRI